MWITRVSINHPVFATMMMAALCVLGLFAYGKLGVEQMPDISFPIAWMETRYPGASAEAVEREVVKPLEEAANGVTGVKRITARASEGQGVVVVEFNLDADMARAMQDLRDRVSIAQATLPRDVRAPLIARFNGDADEPLSSLALLSKTRSARELSTLAEEAVAKRLQRVEGVARVSLGGLMTREVRVDLDPARLRAYGITPSEIAAALREANADQPVGLLSDGTQDAILRIEGRIRDPRQFENVIVARRQGLALALKDVGTLSEREREPDSIARVNGDRAVTLDVFKQQDTNIVKAGEGVAAAVTELKKSLPPDVELRTINNASEWVKKSLDGVRNTLVEGALLTVAIVFLFLHSWRSTVITGLTLPIAVIASFIAVYAFGFTLNFMTMMALSLCIGLLIDDAIVVRENIVRHIHMGKDHHTAAREGTDEIGLAVMATTFALCAVFVPVAFMGGIIGRFFYPFGVTVVAAVLVSLFVSFTLDPMLSSVWKDPPGDRLRKLPGVRWLLRASDAALDAMHRVYEALIRWVFVRPRRNRLIVLGVGLASFVGALALAPLVGSEFVPQTDQGFTRLQLRMPVGSSLDRVDAKVAQVEAVVRALPEVENLSTTVGGVGQRNQANLMIALKPRHDRKRTQREIEDALRDQLAGVPGVEITVGFNRPVNVAILGDDAEGLAKVATEFGEKIKQIPGVVDVELSVKPGAAAFAVTPKPGAVRELGISATQLASSLRTYVNGDAATTWTTPNGNQVDVVLRLPEHERQRIDQLRKLPVAYARDGTPVMLETVADIRPVFNPEVIRRQNLQRREAIFAGVKDRSPGDVGKDVDKLIKETTLPPGFSFDVGGAMQQQAEAFKGLLAAMALAVIFIYIVLASQFGSFVQPLAIMASLPLALIGVMLALLFWRSTLNVFSMIGLVMLMGLVTKNAILLVDFANQARREGASVPDALLQAGLIRMRPIVMTTGAMVFGMLPLALALNEGGELQAPMGRAIIGGVITSTLLTLVVVPVLYSYLVRDRHARERAGSLPSLSAGGGGGGGLNPRPADRA